MTANQRHLAVDYLAALEQYVRDGDEVGRARAYDLGHRAVEARLGLIEFAAIHRDAVGQLVLADPSPAAMTAAIDFFAESLSTFDMAQRGYWEAQEQAAIDRAIAVTLQRSLLPRELPAPPGVDIAVRYLPAGRQAKVGGDWYDVVELEGGDELVLVVGDVMGHGLRQASVMGQLRLGFRAYLAEGHPVPEAVARTDELLQTLGDIQTATLAVVVLDVPGATFSVLGAGHPPPLHVGNDGSPAFMEGGRGRLLGLPGPVGRPLDGPHALAVGDTILLYTDGLLEERERAGARGMDALLDVVGGFSGPPEALCDLVIDALAADGSGDDVCLLAARRQAAPRPA